MSDCDCGPVRFHGTAARADEPEQPIGPGVTIPETISVLLEFSPQHVLGTAVLHRDEAGNILADATVYPDSDPLFHKGLYGPGPNPWPYFALSITGTELVKDDAHPMGVITAGEIRNLALCTANSDPGLPPYKVIQ